MPKYVCDTDLVFSEGKKICDSVNEMNTSTSNYSNNVESDVNGWTGDAAGGKDSFVKAKNDQVESAKNDCTYVNEVGEFIQESAKTIDQLEDDLSALKI